MKQGQFKNEQLVTVLQEADKGEKPISDLCKERRISEATFMLRKRKVEFGLPISVRKLYIVVTQ